MSVERSRSFCPRVPSLLMTGRLLSAAGSELPAKVVKELCKLAKHLVMF